MSKRLFMTCILLLIIMFIFPTSKKAQTSEQLIINHETKKVNMYPYTDLIKDRERTITIDDITPTGRFSDDFIQSSDIVQKRGFFETANWLRFDIVNHSNERDWLLEFAFPLIHEIEIYVDDHKQIKKIYDTGSDEPFNTRSFEHRHFVFDIEVEQGTTKTFYVLAVGSGDLHPPITLWDKDTFIVKTSKEFILLGIFYGIIIVMIIYNLFLFISIKLKSYLYYVVTIIFTLLGKLSINGLAFQYVWPNFPKWNLYAVPIFVTLACLFILLFSRHFLEINRFIPSFNKIFYFLIGLNSITIMTSPFSRYMGLNFMIIFSILTFLTILTAATICLIRGARQARFYLLGWIIFLTGVSVTLLQRAVIVPYSLFTEYAGQAALTVEVVLLSFALADKINMIRQEKEQAEKKYQESQQLALENLKKSDKLKDEFLAITSHELRTPLYGIVGIAESLHDGVTGNISQNMKQQLAMIISSGQRLTHLVDEILDFSKLKYDSIQLDLKPVQINNIVDFVLVISHPTLKNKQIQIVNKIDRNLPIVLADERRLQQILHNLIDNAIKYTEKGDIVLTANYDKETVKVSVHDSGQGISEQQMEQIFQPFQRGQTSLSSRSPGIGIGLNIAKELIKLHDGQLNVTSKSGVGSTFEITFPIYDATLSEEETAVTIVKQEQTKQVNHIQFHNNHNENRPKIVIADDEIVNLQVLTNHLSLQGYNVLTTLNGEDVFQIIQKHQIDLIILDIMMPGMSGYDVCKQLRQSFSLMELPILMLTAKNQLKDKVHAFEAGANDYLVKPCDKQELLARVKTLIKIKTLNEKLIQMNINLENKVLERTTELKQANEQLQMMTESRSQLLANIAHELGTPITFVHNYIQSLQKKIIKIDDVRYQNLVNDKVNILKRLIDDLFNLSLLEANKIKFQMQPINVYQWINKLYDRYELVISQNKRLFQKTRVNRRLKKFTCHVDLERLDQLFSNLIDNAIIHTDEMSGVISFNSEQLNDDRLLIQVSDNGVGIKNEDLPFVFERFYTMNENEQIGSGLGLTIAKQIVLQHDGDISVKSKRHEGTTFSIILPIKKRD